MTHVYAYWKEGYSGEQIRAAIAGMKQAVTESFGLLPAASTVAVREVKPGYASDSLGALVLVYTARNKGIGQKKELAGQLADALQKALPGIGEVKMIIKEQAADMSGYNGMLRSLDPTAMSAYEIGK